MSGGRAQQIECCCCDLQTESECKDVRGCHWHWLPSYPSHSEPRGGVCRGTPKERPVRPDRDRASRTNAYVRLDADYGYEDKGDEDVDNITPKDGSRQFRCYDLHTKSECENVLGCYYSYHHHSHGHGTGSGSCWGKPWDLDHLSGHIPEEIPGLIRLGRSAGILDGEHDVKGDEVERTAPSKEDPSVEYVYEYEEEELPNNKDIYVSTNIESSPPRKGSLRAGESNRRFRALPFDNSSN
eukprot:scaffold4356_cov82-Skeletonema_dohrnii-CCMP3373.AAC.4